MCTLRVVSWDTEILTKLSRNNLLMRIDFTEAPETRVGRKFPAGDLRRTQPITSKAEERGREEGRKEAGEEAEAALQIGGKIIKIEEEEAEERRGEDDHSNGSATLLTSDWLRRAP